MDVQDIVRYRNITLSAEIRQLKNECLKVESVLCSMFETPEGRLLAEAKIHKYLPEDLKIDGEWWFKVWKRKRVERELVRAHIQPGHARWPEYVSLRAAAAAFHHAATILNGHEHALDNFALAESARGLILRLRRQLKQGREFKEIEAWLLTRELVAR